MKIKSFVEIKDFLQEIAIPLGITVAEVEFKQGKNPTLTVYIDKDGGIDLNTCELFHRAIDAPLDQLDPTFGQAHIGERVEVKLVNSIKGKKFYDGILVSYDGKIITLKVDEKNTFTIDLKNTVKVNEYIDFD